MKKRLSGLALMLVACSANSITVTVGSFDQAGEVAFLCFENRVGDDGVRDALPLSRCDASTGEGGTLHALVTQTRRGELATVDLSVDANEDNLSEGAVLDLDGRVPGFTFAQVGELPSAVEVAETGPGRAGGPRFVYVANRGSQDISILPVERLVRQNASITPPTIPPPVSAPVFGGVTDLTLTVDGSRLLAAVPEAGAVVVFDVEDEGETLTFLHTVELPTDIPDAVEAVEEPDYCWACTFESTSVSDACENQLLSPWPAAGRFPPRPSTSLGSEPRPVSFAVDNEDRVPSPDDRILVADESLPVVHVLDGHTGDLVDRFSLSVPVSELAVSPSVATEVGGSDTTRYLYAIDAIDGSVLAADYPSRAVLPVAVAPGEAADRISFEERALALTVAFPLATSDQDPGPIRLNGVFLIVALADGFLRFVDIEDREIQARTQNQTQCLGEQLFLRRHRPRLDELDERVITLAQNPRVTREGQATTVDDLGESNLSLGFEPVSCAAGERSVFGEPSRICALADPWTVRNEEWRLTWEGTLPGSEGARGRLTPEGEGATALTAALPFCALGALGSDNSAGLGGGSYDGDLLVVRGPLPASFSTECENLFLDEFDELGRVAFPVLNSFSGGLRLGPPEPVLRGGRGTRTVTREEITNCFGTELARFVLQANGRYLVTATTSPFLHPVVADQSVTPDPVLGHPCRIDPTEPARGRARHGSPFLQGRIRFHVSGTTPVAGEDVAVSFNVVDSPFHLVQAIGSNRTAGASIASSMSYNRLDQRLYVVDQGRHGLVPYQLTILEARPVIN